METTKKNTTVMEQYEGPSIEVVDITPEGVLCASFKTPGEDDDPLFG